MIKLELIKKLTELLEIAQSEYNFSDKYNNDFAACKFGGQVEVLKSLIEWVEQNGKNAMESYDVS